MINIEGQDRQTKAWQQTKVYDKNKLGLDRYRDDQGSAEDQT